MNKKYSCYILILFVISIAHARSQTFKSENDFKNYFTDHIATLDPAEGLWKVVTSQEFYNFDTLYDKKSFVQTVAILKRDSAFLTYDMKGEEYNVYFTKTNVNKVYLFKIYLKEINQYTKTDAVIAAGNTMNYTYEFPEEYLRLMFKNTFEKGDRVVNAVNWDKVFPK